MRRLALAGAALVAAGSVAAVVWLGYPGQSHHGSLVAGVHSAHPTGCDKPSPGSTDLVCYRMGVPRLITGQALTLHSLHTFHIELDKNQRR